MCAAIRRGQLGIVNGTYSQAHLHTLSLEGSVRQFAVGTRSIRENFDYQVRTYAMQSRLHDQTPQILKAFGIGTRTAASAISTIRRPCPAKR